MSGSIQSHENSLGRQGNEESPYPLADANAASGLCDNSPPSEILLRSPLRDALDSLRAAVTLAFRV